MPEAFCEPWQQFEDKDGVERQKMLVAACGELGLNVISSQPLIQGMATDIALSRDGIPSVYNQAARHLQLLRSIPTKSLFSTLVGMKETEHVRANLEVIKKPLMTRDEFFKALHPHRRTEFIDDEMSF